MGTNVYYLSKNKDAVLRYFGESYELTDFPYLAYEIHVLKRSGGWLPLWQAHDKCNSVKEYKVAYDSGFFEIYDEYGDKYTWEEFWDQFAMFNGGVRGAMPPTKIERDASSPFYDPRMPDHTPISHFDYKYDYYYINDYFADEDGFEFDKREFS
jgi:hypothetical protein